MDNLEGILMVPPERGLLGRAMWKPRYVVVGRRTTLSRDHQSSPSYSQFMSATRIVSSGSKSSAKTITDEPCIAVYKSKEDPDPIQQWPLNCVVDCQVQMLAKRKQGSTTPTLVVTMTDKERKRRSSRAGSLIPASKDGNPGALWFRASPEDPYPTLQDWARCIMSKKVPMSPGESPLTPTSSTTFSPVTFSPRQQRDTSDYFNRPDSGPANRSLHHKSSTATYSSGAKERPHTFSSESPSLRSKRSDISSPSSGFPSQQANYGVPGQYYTTVLPTDLPSPVTTNADYQGDFIKGWTAAQGRSSTMSSPTQGRDSISSHAHKASLTGSSSPPPPRETILDRAFQMRSMSNSEQSVPGEEKLSSVARFDALMREVDEKRKKREAAERAENLAMRSAFEADDSSDADDSHDDGTDSDDDNFAHFQPPLIPSSTQRALQYASGRAGPLGSPTSTRPGISRQNLSFHAKAATQNLVRQPPDRPHTAHEKNRRANSQRTQSTHFVTSTGSDLAAAAGKRPDDGNIRSGGDHRQSSSSTKRLSFTEFTTRLSSTSSLLLVQTNASGSSSRRSSEIDANPATVPRTNMKSPYQKPASRDRDRIREEQEKRCSWRGGIGVAEGGFF